MSQIDTFSETILSVDQAAKHVGKISGKKRNRSVILRWSNRGVSGVRLRTIQIGGDIFTSQEALNEFLNAVRDAKRDRRSKETATGIRRAKVSDALEAEADSHGI